ncbi:MAG: ABC transporter ATP-binding protein [Thermoplasmata archaeon]|jgi:ABC-2 type transport system ATP-binding protein
MNFQEIVIETKNLTKYFGDFIAVNNLNLKVFKGEIYGLLGPNGAGKTTTIKILVGLLKQTSGEAYILGEKIPPPESIRQSISYMPQDIGLYMDLTVRENLEIWGGFFNIPSTSLSKKIQNLLKFMAMESFENEIVSKLSGGMKRRLSFACSLINDAQLLFLDEPTVGVDPELRVSFWEYFMELSKQGKTIIFTTHYMEEANRCDRIGFMYRGSLIAEGTPNYLKEITNTSNLDDAFLIFSRKQGNDKVDG